MKVFVIDFSGDSALIDLCKRYGHEVAFEQCDGAEAYRQTRSFMPDCIVVNYAHKPSHGRITAEKIHQRKSTAHIPIYFVGIGEEDYDKVRAIGVPLTLHQLEKLLRDKQLHHDQ